MVSIYIFKIKDTLFSYSPAISYWTDFHIFFKFKLEIYGGYFAFYYDFYVQEKIVLFTYSVLQPQF